TSCGCTIWSRTSLRRQVMPQDEPFWNPYRWVQTSQQPVDRDTPGYAHRFGGLAGRLSCELEALTPLLIGDGSKGQGRAIEFIRKNGRPFIPGTSLKGTIRSLAELVGNAAVPFGQSDGTHAPNRSATGTGNSWRLDVTARMFGYLDQ